MSSQLSSSQVARKRRRREDTFSLSQSFSATGDGVDSGDPSDEELTVVTDPSCPTELQKTNDDSIIVHPKRAPTGIRFEYNWVDWTEFPRHRKPLETTNKLMNWVWNHGVPLEYKDLSKPDRFWLCKECFLATPRKIILLKSHRGLWSVRNHLQSKHPSADNVLRLGDSSFDAVTYFRRIGLDPSKPEHQPVIEQLLVDIDLDKAIKELLRWIVKHHIPFQRIEDEEFREFCRLIQPRLRKDGAIPSRATVRRNIVMYYSLHKAQVRTYLYEIPGQLHLAFDLWTSNNNLALNGIVAQFLTQDYTINNCLLGLSQLFNSHEGVNIAKDVAKVLRSYNMCSRIGYCTLDNAGNNDTAIREILRLIKPRDAHPEWAQWRRIRCFGHILNLIARAFLFGADKDIFEAEARVYDGVNSQQEVELWRRLGPIGKLHNLVKWVKKTPQRHGRFQRAVKSYRRRHDIRPRFLELLQNNNTRWNSTYLMIARAIELMAESYYTLLAPLYEATMQLQGRTRVKEYIGLGYVIPTMEYILKSLENAKTTYQEDSVKNRHYLAAIEHAWAKANEYYGKLDDSPAYVAALVLDPRRKWAYLEHRWRDNPGWVDVAKQQVLKLWRLEYREKKSPTPAGQDQEDPQPISALRAAFQEEIMECFPVDDVDEYEAWVRLARVGKDPVEYWSSASVQSEFPKLSRMALDIMSIPCMSDEPERIFSLAGLLISNRRGRLKTDIIEASECLGNWDRKGLIHIGQVPEVDEAEDYVQDIDESDEEEQEEAAAEARFQERLQHDTTLSQLFELEDEDDDGADMRSATGDL